jgi:glycosyltransferase involved in cell wall biosynthesis
MGPPPVSSVRPELIRAASYQNDLCRTRFRPAAPPHICVDHLGLVTICCLGCSFTMTPKVSVVIPSYNNAALLCETLDGVGRQTFRDFEIIVVDDGSTDATAETVGAYGPGIRYIHQLNQGPAAARNRGVSLAQGEFIAFCDHDDVWNERHLEQLVGSFIEYPSAAMCFDNAQYYREAGGGGNTHIDKEVLQSMIGKTVPIQRLWQCWVASMSVVMLKKAVFEKLGGLHPGIWGLDDLHFYLRLVAAGYDVRYVDYVGCKKRVATNSLLRQRGLDGLIRCLEDLKRNHPDVVRAIGSRRLRTRLARRYRKLGERYVKDGQRNLGKVMFLKAFKENYFNLHHLWRYLACRQQRKTSSLIEEDSR